MENTNRNVFSLSGVSGLLIATILLLSILVVLTIIGLNVQKKAMDNPYSLKDPQNIKMFGSNYSDFVVNKDVK